MPDILVFGKVCSLVYHRLYSMEHKVQNLLPCEDLAKEFGLHQLLLYFVLCFTVRSRKQFKYIGSSHTFDSTISKTITSYIPIRIQALSPYDTIGFMTTLNYMRVVVPLSFMSL